jgi:hypothetical protein
VTRREDVTVVREENVEQLLAEQETEFGPDRAVTVHYLAAFSGVPDATVVRIAHARNRVEPTLRGLLLACLAEPGEETPLAMLRDYIEERQVVRPAYIVGSGGVRMSTAEKMSRQWWWGQRGVPSALVWNMPWGRHEHAVRNDEPLFSVNDVCDLSAREIMEIPHMGVYRLKQLRQWLAHFGLFLRGETPSLFPTEKAGAK